ncbi:hypothetical protein EIP91_008693 [Steccherinum ochraceum]|uniref:MYND-type domain-containing protein n=1 Tax=Steccherinum ochraceum TaxID=92696 RepID=A0A4R0R2H0_9APHY|nr:hypothetical protein EIP91_008693 [Steccherinum ochraceum]
MSQLADPRPSPLPVTEQLNLPPFAEVKEQAALLSRLRRSQELSIEDCMGLFPKLFLFCLLVEMFDVPDYMLDDIVLVSKMFIRYLLEDPSGTFTRASSERDIKYEMVEVLRMKRLTWLTTEPVFRPLEALEEVEVQIEAYKNDLRRRGSQYVDTPWITGLHTYVRYGDMLILSNKFGPETHDMLQKIIDACYHPYNTDTANIITFRSMTHMHLALLGEISGRKGEEHDRHVEAAVRYFRKHRTGCRHVGELFLKRPDQPTHPVYVALGEDWFTNRPSLRDDRNPGKFCMFCSKAELKASLSKCARCKFVFYCSRECQKADWKVHKPTCQAYVSEQKLIDEVRKRQGPQAALQLADISRWRHSSHYANFEALIHALGLRQDPNRGRTHIVLRQVECVSDPRPVDFRDRVRVTKFSVYKLADVVGEVARIQGSLLSPRALYADLQRLVDDVLQEGPDGKVLPHVSPSRFRHLALVDLTVGPGIKPLVNAINVSENYVRLLKYEPDWRQHINRIGAPPEPFKLAIGAEDAEHMSRLADPRQGPAPWGMARLGIEAEMPPFDVVKEQVLAFMGSLRFADSPVDQNHTNVIGGLLQFCLLVETFDVPDYMLDDIIFITKMFQDYWPEALESLTVEKRVAASQLVDHLRDKRIMWLFMDPVNRPLEALEEIEVQIQALKQELELSNSPYRDTPWIPKLYVYARYADALVLGNKFDPDTHTVLRNVLEACDHPVNADDPVNFAIRSIMHMHLALFGKMIGSEGAEHDRSTCQSYAGERQRVEEARRTHGPQAAIRMADFQRWEYSSHYANMEALIHALGLRQNPNRGRTHIVFREVKHVLDPRPADFRDRLCVTKCSVYRIKDVVRDIAKCLNNPMTPKALYEYLKKAGDEEAQADENGKPLPGAPPSRFRRVVIIYSTASPIAGGQGFKWNLHINHVSENYVRALKYEPDWRQYVNGVGPPPEPFILTSGAPDAEHDFDDS